MVDWCLNLAFLVTSKSSRWQEITWEQGSKCWEPHYDHSVLHILLLVKLVLQSSHSQWGGWAGHVYRHKYTNTISPTTSTFQKLKTTKWMFLSRNRFIIYRKVWSWTKFWGMKTGLLRQCFLPWSVSKPPVSSVWLSPRFYSDNRTLRAWKSTINWLYSKLFHLSNPGEKETVSKLSWNQLAKT